VRRGGPLRGARRRCVVCGCDGADRRRLRRAAPPRGARSPACHGVRWGRVSTGTRRRLLSSRGLRRMKIAILGTRGIPASYSGFETAVEQLASRLTDRGHDVTVYCRPHVVDATLKQYKGASLVHLRTVQNKYLDTFVHTALSAIHAARTTRPDVALFFIAG